MNINAATLSVAKRILDRNDPSADDARCASAELIGAWKLAFELDGDEYLADVVFCAANELLMGIATGRDPKDALKAARAVLEKA